jgi:probable phosphoglycerate mutase
MTQRTFYFIRHGQTDWNAQRRWQGQTDITLNEEGRQQARALAGWLANAPLDRVMSSDLSRAYETAQLATAPHALPIEIDPRWREFNGGQIEGKAWDELEREMPEVVHGLSTDWFDYVMPGGESRRQLQARAASVFAEVLADGRGQHIAIFSHGATLRVLMVHLFPELYIADPKLSPTFENTAVMIVSHDGARFSVVQEPLTPHLAAQG